MKTINVTFEDRDFKNLVKLKGSLSWESFILKLLSEPTEEELREEFELTRRQRK